MTRPNLSWVRAYFASQTFFFSFFQLLSRFCRAGLLTSADCFRRFPLSLLALVFFSLTSRLTLTACQTVTVAHFADDLLFPFYLGGCIGLLFFILGIAVSTHRNKLLYSLSIENANTT